METCNGWCSWLREQYTMPFRYRMTCAAANGLVVAEGQSSEPLVGKWRSQVRTAAVSEQACVAPPEKTVFDPTDLDSGGMDPFASIELES